MGKKHYHNKRFSSVLFVFLVGKLCLDFILKPPRGITPPKGIQEDAATSVEEPNLMSNTVSMYKITITQITAVLQRESKSSCVNFNHEKDTKYNGDFSLIGLLRPSPKK